MQYSKRIRIFLALVFAVLIMVCSMSVLYPQEIFTYGASQNGHKIDFSGNSKSTVDRKTKNHLSTRSSTIETTHFKTEISKLKETPPVTWDTGSVSSGQQNRTRPTDQKPNLSRSKITDLVTSPNADASNEHRPGHTSIATMETTHSKTKTDDPEARVDNSSDFNCKTQTSQIEHNLMTAIEDQFDMFKGAMKAMQRERQTILDKACREKYGVNRSTLQPDYEAFEIGSKQYHPTIYYSEKYKVMFCEVAKAGCTQWKLALLEMENIVTDPYKLEHERIHASAYGARTMLENVKNMTKVRKVLDSYLGIITVRNPFERLLSAYFDKLAPRKNFTHPKYTPISERIRKKYHESNTEQKRATFENFIDFLLEENEKGSQLDLHWDLFTRACNPCSYHYDYIARLETIEKDAKYLEDVLGLNNDTRRETPITLFHGAKDSRTKAKTSAIKLVTSFSKVPREKRLRLYEMYMPDFITFGYPYPTELLI